MKMRKTLAILLLFVATAAQAQLIRSNTIVGQPYERSIDLSQPRVWQEAAATDACRPLRRAAPSEGVRWIDRIHNLPDHMKDFYDRYGAMVHDALEGKQNGLTDPTRALYSESDKSYHLTLKTFKGTINFTYPTGSSGEEIARYAQNAAKAVCEEQWNQTNCFMLYLCMCLTYDFPEGFWLNSYYSWGCQRSYSYGYQPNGNSGEVTYENNIYFTLKNEDFDHRRTEFQSPATLAAAITEYNQLVATLAADCPKGYWRYNAVAWLNDYLAQHNCYNSDFYVSGDVATIARSPMSALRGSVGKTGPVCEGYARAFKVVCDRLGIPCVLAVGYARSQKGQKGESHMWNEVEMENGKWYAVDVTWNDPITGQNVAKSGKENRKWLLLGKEDVVGPNLTFEESHPMNLTWSLDPENEQYWDYEVQTFIERTGYDRAAGITAPRTKGGKTPSEGYTISGQRLPSEAQNRNGNRPRLVISQGKKRIEKF